MYTKDQLLGSTRAKGNTSIGLDHDGRARAAVPVHPGQTNPNDRSHEHVANRRINGGNVARDGGAPKAHAPVPAHGGMHSRTRDGQHVQGMTQTTLANAPDASGVRPLDPTVPGKVFALPQPVIGQRSRSDEVGPEPVGAGHRRNVGNLDHALGRAIIEDALQRRR